MAQMIRYEIKNAMGNVFAIFFGIIFPIIMTLVFSSLLKSQVPADQFGKAMTQLFITNLLMSPLALLFIGFAALFSQEIEKDITTRMVLFGFSEQKQLKAKFVAQALSLVVAVTVYSLTVLPILKIDIPSLFGVLVLMGAVIVLSFLYFVLAYSIAVLARKFSVTYGITMTFYFVTMALSGMMGIQYDQLPSGIQVIARLLPTTYIVKDVPKLWTVSSYNLMPMLQSFLTFAAITGLIYMFAMHKKARRIG